jgi:hypothetical protein
MLTIIGLVEMIEKLDQYLKYHKWERENAIEVVSKHKDYYVNITVNTPSSSSEEDSE